MRLDEIMCTGVCVRGEIWPMFVASGSCVHPPRADRCALPHGDCLLARRRSSRPSPGPGTRAAAVAHQVRRGTHPADARHPCLSV
jgi:hypothetical protein